MSGLVMIPFLYQGDEEGAGHSDISASENNSDSDEAGEIP